MAKARQGQSQELCWCCGAEVVQKRVKEAQHTEAEINLAREKYRVVPHRGSTLYFVMADLPLIDPMYQYSLDYFIQVFNHCIKSSPKSMDLPTRLRTLLDFTTHFVYTTVSIRPTKQCPPVNTQSACLLLPCCLLPASASHYSEGRSFASSSSAACG